MNKLMLVVCMVLSFIGCSNESTISENVEYELIKFTDFEVVNSDLALIEGKKFELVVEKNGTVFINDNDAIIQNEYDKFYTVDIDNDNIKEVITRTTEKMISPFTNNYHIYKYFEKCDDFEEIATISIMGTIDSFYIKGDDIKVEYHPYESPEDYVETKYFKIKSVSEEKPFGPVMRDDKPIIYLYPTEEKIVEVKLGYPEKLTCVYPEYKDGWKVLAKPDGTLKDLEKDREYYALYWEGINTQKVDMTEGFVVKGEDTIEFLEEKLAKLGLTDKEAEEFIVYWLPKLQENKYNYIRFATQEEINEEMPLMVSGNPDYVIRVLMQFKGLDEEIEVVEQEIVTPKREGFVVVEWGGTELK